MIKSSNNILNNNLNSKQILFIGGGNMASAIISGLCSSNNNNNITVVDHNTDKLTQLKQLFNINTVNNIDDLFNISNKNLKINLNQDLNKNLQIDIIILAVKPKNIKSVCNQIAELTNNYNTINPILVISIAAGINIHNINKWLNNNNNFHIIRSMPNTPSSIQLGTTILYQDLKNNPENNYYKNITDDLFQSIGQTIWVDTEQEINTTMAISGCGPAYIFLLCESLMAAAKEQNINKNLAKKLVYNTIKGSVEYFNQSDKSASELRNNVTSPNGTTEAALNVLNIENTKKLYKKAIAAAVLKAKELEKTIK